MDIAVLTSIIAMAISYLQLKQGSKTNAFKPQTNIQINQVILNLSEIQYQRPQHQDLAQGNQKQN